MASLPSVSWSEQTAPVQRKGNIRQSVCRWCYQSTPLDKLCAYAAQIGLKGVDLLNPKEWEVPARYGLIWPMGYAGGGEIGGALYRTENYSKIEEAFCQNISLPPNA